MTNVEIENKVPSRGRLTVVLDIDETLIHTSKGTDNASKDCFQIVVQGEVFTVRKRPHLDEFLIRASEKYELVAYTAGIEEYSRAVLQAIDPCNMFFKACLFRQHCVRLSKNSFTKNLQLLNRSADRIVLVDDTLNNFLLQPENGIPITTFVDDSTDTALSVLLGFLKILEKAEDVRVPLRQTFQLQHLLQAKNPSIVNNGPRNGVTVNH